eukprot:TRINITY_DN17210_c0_g1_i10.p1 TRINITY_DN17210_c0_g1~~TRINITY_DN17210_c0_g1_i10.p1  ORF type:complete len:119 (+),score=5.40 TRINITY_DN17210_c0_g1_i10:99-455(+)
MKRTPTSYKNNWTTIFIHAHTHFIALNHSSSFHQLICQRSYPMDPAEAANVSNVSQKSSHNPRDRFSHQTTTNLTHTKQNHWETKNCPKWLQPVTAITINTGPKRRKVFGSGLQPPTV